MNQSICTSSLYIIASYGHRNAAADSSVSDSKNGRQAIHWAVEHLNDFMATWNPSFLFVFHIFSWCFGWFSLLFKHMSSTLRREVHLLIQKKSPLDTADATGNAATPLFYAVKAATENRAFAVAWRSVWPRIWAPTQLEINETKPLQGPF